MQDMLPRWLAEFRKKQPGVWQAFEALGQACHESGPLDEKTRRLVKLGIAIALRQEGAVHSAVRNAVSSGITEAELYHAAILSITTIGWPGAYAAMTWIEEALERRGTEDIPES